MDSGFLGFCMLVSLSKIYDGINKTAERIRIMAAPTVTLKHIAAELAEKHGMSKKETTEFLESMVENFVTHLKSGDRIRIQGLGILEVKQMKERMGRNPQTGEAIKIPAKKKVAFRVAKDLKESVL